MIVGGILRAGNAAHSGQPVFWPESAVLLAFSLSRLVKGCACITLTSAARSLFRR